MSEATCPACGKPVDPLRAPAVAVKAGRVIGYCSQACAARGEAAGVAPVSAPRRDQTPVPGKRRDQTPVPKKSRTPPAGVSAVSDYDSGPVIEIIHEPASGVVTSAPDARTGLTKASDFAEAAGAIQIDEPDRSPPRRGRTWIAIAIVVVLGGGAFAAYQLGLLGADRSSHAATTPSPAPHVAEPAAAPKPPPPPPKPKLDGVGISRDLLHGELASSDPHVKRLAAEALARTGASEAMVELIAALPAEPSATAKIEIEYVLARGQDRRGTDGLLRDLQSQEHDDRLDAAGRLAVLGDKRAAPVLAHYLDVPQHLLGAASYLAYLADPQAIAALDAIRKDPNASDADKARAAVALGIAGKADVAPALRVLLADPHFNAAAAAALVELHDRDPAVKRVLIDQLKVPALCVDAARALRRIDPPIDVQPQVEQLVAAARVAQGAERIADAEAALVLAGQPAWAEHP